MTRLFRVYGVTAEMVAKALALPAQKVQRPETLTPSERIHVFGHDADVIDTEPEQLELAEGAENGNGNGRARIIRRADQIDLAFLRSHEFTVLRGHNDPFETVGRPPFKVYGEEGEAQFETDNVIALHDHLFSIGQKGISIQRYKGLGEMNAEELKETTMDPEKRTILKVTVEDMSLASETFEVLMGDQVEPRKIFIEKHAADVRNLDV